MVMVGAYSYTGMRKNDDFLLGVNKATQSSS